MMKKFFKGNEEIYIYGAGEMGKKTCEEALKQGFPIKGFIDKYKEGTWCNLPIYALGKIKEETNSIIIISIQNIYSVIEIYKDIKDKSSTILWNWGGIKKESLRDTLIDISGWGECILPRMDMHLSDKCNLNCVGCTHFSPLFEEVGCEYDVCMNNIDLVLEKFTGIARLNLLGGEPLLNKDLNRIISGIRHKLPQTTISFFTNGLLLCKVPKSVLRSFRDNNIKVYISEYAPTHKIITQIKEVLEMYNVSYELSGYSEKLHFNKPLSNKSVGNENTCMSVGCVTVSDGKIARCPTLLYVDRLNQEFGCEFPTDGTINLKDCNFSGDNINDKLCERVPLCDYCIKNEIEWNVCGRKKKITDFVKLEG